ISHGSPKLCRFEESVSRFCDQVERAGPERLRQNRIVLERCALDDLTPALADLVSVWIGQLCFTEVVSCQPFPVHVEWRIKLDIAESNVRRREDKISVFVTLLWPAKYERHG